jgi:hypothetical protein
VYLYGRAHGKPVECLLTGNRAGDYLTHMRSTATAYPRVGAIEVVEYSQCAPGGEKKQIAFVKDNDRWMRIWHAWRFGTKSGIVVTHHGDPEREDECTGENSHFSRTPPGYQSFAKFYVEGPIGNTEVRFETSWPNLDAAYTLNRLGKPPPLYRQRREIVMSADGRYLSKAAWQRGQAERQARVSSPRPAEEPCIPMRDLSKLAADFIASLPIDAPRRSATRLAPSNDRDEELE